MRIVGAIVLLCMPLVALTAQTPKRIFLSPKSNITTSQVSEGFQKNCPNVMITENQEKADYVLEAAETVSADEGTTNHRWHFTLMNRDGDVLMTTHPEFHLKSKFKHHFQQVCKFVNK